VAKGPTPKPAAIPSQDQNRDTIGAMTERFPRRTHSSLRTDEQLLAILDEAAEWSVNDKRGKVLYSAASLRDAVKEAMVYQAASQELIAICQQPGDAVIIFRAQINRLGKSIGAA
jgi:hypothetical protein